MTMSGTDREHGSVIGTIANEIAWIFIHEDGYREVIYIEDMEEQEVQIVE